MSATGADMDHRTLLGACQGFMSAEHAVPPGFQVRELKACENCTQIFTRPRPLAFRRFVVKNPRDHFFFKRGGATRFAEEEPETSTVYQDTGQRYCPRCVSAALVPVDDREYRDELPREVEMRHAHHLPRYDESIVKFAHRQPFKSVVPVPPPRGTKAKLGDWKQRLKEAFADLGPLSAKDIAAITGHTVRNGSPSTVLSALTLAKIRVVPVASVWPPPSCMGPKPWLFTQSGWPRTLGNARRFKHR